MARSRNIKPAFFKNDILAALPPFARLLFAGLWTLADKSGLLEDRPRRIKAEILPYDDVDIDALLEALAGRGPLADAVAEELGSRPDFIERYTATLAGAPLRLIFVRKWASHQNPHKNEIDSGLPPPMASPSPQLTASADVTATTEQIRQAPDLFGRDRPDSLNTDSLNTDSLNTTAPSATGGPNGKPAKKAKPNKNRSLSRHDFDLADILRPDSFQTADVDAALARWLEYKALRREAYKAPGSITALIRRFEADHSLEAPSALIYAIDLSMGSNYAGLVDKYNDRPKKQRLRRTTATAEDPGRSRF